MIKDMLYERLEKLHGPNELNLVRIKIGVDYIKMRSGKTVWNGVGPAKNALRNEFQSMKGIFCAKWSQSGFNSYKDAKEHFEKEYNEFIENSVTFERLCGLPTMQ